MKQEVNDNDECAGDHDNRGGRFYSPRSLGIDNRNETRSAVDRFPDRGYLTDRPLAISDYPRLTKKLWYSDRHSSRVPLKSIDHGVLSGGMRNARLPDRAPFDSCRGQIESEGAK